MAARLSAQDLIGGRYRIEAPLGEGSMGIVFRAYDEREKRSCALKVIHTEIAGSSHQIRFKREFRATARLAHPHCVRSYDFGEHDGQIFMTMEYIPGGALSLNRSSRISIVVGLALQLLAGLDYIHGHGIIHRDIKPQNILVDHLHDHRLHARLGDFGIATLAGFPEDEHDVSTILGSLRFLAPETHDRGVVDPRSDLYSLGIILYCLIAGEHPFGDQARSPRDWLALHRRGLMTRLDTHQPTLPASLVNAIHGMCRREPDDRFSDAASAYDAVLKVLPELSEPPPRLEHPPLLRRPHLAGPAFIGRDVEAELLRDFCRMTLEGRHGPCTLMVCGQAGQGKSRLIRELLVDSMERNISVFAGTCRAEASAAYEPLHELLQALEQLATLYSAMTDITDFDDVTIRSQRRAAPDDPTADISVLATANPYSPIVKEESEGTDTVAGQLQTHRRWTTLMRILCHERPILVVVEDLQWAEPATLRLLSSMARAVATAREIDERWPIGFVITQRPSTAAELVAYRESLESSDTLRLLELHPLSDNASVELLASMLMIAPSQIPSEFVRPLLDKAGGSPLFLSQMLYALLGQRLLTHDQHGQWHLDASLLRGANLPASVDMAIGEQAARVAATSKQVLSAAAVCGRRFGLDALRDVTNLDELAILDAVDELIRASFIEELPAEYRFIHDRIRESIYDTLSDRQRDALHRAVASHLVTRHGDQQEHWPAIAHHYAQCGQHEQAYTYALKAAEHASRTYAYGLAVELYRLALRLAAELEGLKVDSGVLERQGDAYTAVGRFSEAVHCYEQRLQAPLSQDERVLVLSKLATLRHKQGAHGEAVRAMEDVLRLTGMEPPVTKLDLRLRTLQLLLELALPARPWLGSQIRGEIRIRSGALLTDSWYHTGHFDHSVYYSLLATATARRLGPTPASIRALAIFGLVMGCWRMPRLSRHYLAQARVCSQQVDAPVADRAWLEVADGVAYLMCGETEPGLARLDEADDRFGSSPSSEAKTQILYYRSMALLAVGRSDRQCIHLEERIRNLGEDLNDNRMRGCYRHRRGLRLARAGRVEEAINLLQEACRLARSSGDIATYTMTHDHLALWLALRGDITQALHHGEIASRAAMKLQLRIFIAIDVGFLTAAAEARLRGKPLSRTHRRLVRQVLRVRAFTAQLSIAREMFAVARAAWQVANGRCADFDGPITRLTDAKMLGEAWLGHHIAAHFDRARAEIHEQAKTELQAQFLAS